ncbi:uncharacterized protein B0H18DRAFT_855484, partial [Fomitopsis serialis]|uniref:uncharacterized protein n=1 Tax=Fomitopsis serialis TaxID=139415 RepID=UPI0020078D79
LSFLHVRGVAHHNVKPSNLVYTADYRLQIIGFDVAVYVAGEDDAVEGFCGMAPEVGDGCAYNAVRADRWACGRVL